MVKSQGNPRPGKFGENTHTTITSFIDLVSICFVSFIHQLKMTGDDKPAPSMTTLMLSGKAKQKGQIATVENASSLAGQQRIDHLANSEVCLASLKGKVWTHQEHKLVETTLSHACTFLFCLI